jgi:hypothetical protein
MESYAPRSFRFVELLRIDDWRMKLYGIAWRGERPRPELIKAAKRRNVPDFTSYLAERLNEKA